MLSSCQSRDATLQKLLLANMSVHTMYKYSLHIQTVTKWSVVDGYVRNRGNRQKNNFLFFDCVGQWRLGEWSKL